MAVSYNKLWKLLIDKKMTKTQLCKKANVSTNAMAKLGKNEDVRVEVLIRICKILGCTIDDIMDSLSFLIHLIAAHFFVPAGEGTVHFAGGVRKLADERRKAALLVDRRHSLFEQDLFVQI